jgi:hypothetical protein
MKRIYTILAAVLITASVFLPQQVNAQTPEKMTYQSVIRNTTDQLVTNHGIGMKISILQTTATGTAVYAETHNTTTNANGLVTVEIGNGTVVSGDFTTIDWSSDIYFIKTETDPTQAGGTAYTITGTSQLLSVPYALHAKTADIITGGITEADPVFTGSEANNITATDITNLSNLSGTNTGNQDISGITINTQAIQDTASQIRADFPDVSGFITTETDPIYSAWNKSYNDLTNKPNIVDTVSAVIDTTTQFVRKPDQWIKNGNNLYYSNGNVGVGTINPTANLHVYSTSDTRIRSEGVDPRFDLFGANHWHMQSVDANGRFRIFDETTGAERLSILTNGNIGIGNISPNAKLEVNADASSVGLIVKSNTSSPGNIQEWKNGSNTTLNYVPNDGGIVFENLNTSGKGIKFMADQTTGVSGAYGTFQPVSDNTSAGMTVMPKGSGNYSSLSVCGTDILADPANARQFVFSANSSSFYIWPRNYGTETAKPFYIYKPGNVVDAAISIATDGNVGINTATPEAPLHINDFMKLEPRNTVPSSPSKGMIYYDSTDDKLKVYTGSAWENLN